MEWSEQLERLNFPPSSSSSFFFFSWWKNISNKFINTNLDSYSEWVSTLCGVEREHRKPTHRKRKKVACELNEIAVEPRRRQKRFIIINCCVINELRYLFHFLSSRVFSALFALSLVCFNIILNENLFHVLSLREVRIHSFMHHTYNNNNKLEIINEKKKLKTQQAVKDCSFACRMIRL